MSLIIRMCYRKRDIVGLLYAERNIEEVLGNAIFGKIFRDNPRSAHANLVRKNIPNYMYVLIHEIYS